MAKDQHPDDYGDLMLEALRVVSIAPDEVIIGYQIWDMDDFDNEVSMLFRAKGFQKPERLLSTNALFMDLWYGDNELFVLERNEVHRFAKGNFKKPTASMKLPIKDCKAIAGNGAKDLYVVGDGIAHFDGKSWTKLAVKDKKAEFSCITVHGDVAYAAGDDGCLVEISGGKVRDIKAPNPDKRAFTAICLDSKGVLSVGGRGICLQGPPDKLTALKLPKDAEDAVGVAEFKGKIHWGFVGDDEGMGMFVQNGKKFEALNGEMNATIAATDRFLYSSGESLVLRYDGDDFVALNLDYDEDTSKWKLDVAEKDDGSDEDEDDDEEDDTDDDDDE